MGSSPRGLQLKYNDSKFPPFSKYSAMTLVPMRVIPFVLRYKCFMVGFFIMPVRTSVVHPSSRSPQFDKS